jgi:hypothetical protein
MSNIIKEKVDNAKLLVNLAYLRTEYSSQNTYFATMRIAFAFALVSAYTKSYHILGFSIVLLLGGYLQYKFMGQILIDINELTRKNTNNFDYNKIYLMREINNYIFIFYTLIFILAILLQFYHKKK